MSLIKKASELEIPSTLKLMVYGQAGMGKTTFALSAPNPLLLDFDGGVKRVNQEHLKDTVQITKWQEVQQVLQENLSEYQTIVIDTIGKMMDFIITYKCGTRQPRVQDWGGINQEFDWLIRAVSSLNKNIVFVAHRDTRKEGDETVFVPALREKNYNKIVTELDLLGYMEMRAENGQQHRTITFDPTSRNDGKNTCNLPSVMMIPNIIDKTGKITGKNDFITNSIIAPYKAMLSAKQAAKQDYDKVCIEIDELIDTVTDADSANNFMEVVKSIKHVGSSLTYARTKFGEKVKELGITYNAKTKSYEQAGI